MEGDRTSAMKSFEKKCFKVSKTLNYSIQFSSIQIILKGKDILVLKALKDMMIIIIETFHSNSI